MSCRVERAPAARRPPQTPRPGALRPSGWRCAPPEAWGREPAPACGIPPLTQPDFLRGTNPPISKGGARPPARTLSVRGAAGRAWTLF